MIRYVVMDGLRMKVGSPTYRFILRNRARLIGDVPKPKPYALVAKKALKLAGHFVGVKEYPAGSNLQMFGRWYGMNGVPWCAIFVSYVLSHVGRPFKYASVPAIVNDARQGKNGLSVIHAVMVNATIAAGHPVLACYDWTDDGIADHVEFAVSVAKDVVHAIGGNTGPADWSNGGEVAREDRALGLVQAFVKVGKA